jgi:hypothetical protein
MTEWGAKAAAHPDLDDLADMRAMFEARSRLLMRVMRYPARNVPGFREAMDAIFADAWDSVESAHGFEADAQEVFRMRKAFDRSATGKNGPTSDWA